MAETAVLPKSTKDIWPLVILVVVFLVAMWIVSKAKSQTITLKDNGDGTMEGVVTDTWFQRKAV